MASLSLSAHVSALKHRQSISVRHTSKSRVVGQTMRTAARASSNGAAQQHLETTHVGSSTNIRWHESMVQREDKELLLGQRGCVLWFTGLSASGKSTVACTLEHILSERGHFTMVLDGDNIRHGLNHNLGFSAEDRKENIRRIGEVAKIMAESGVVCLSSFISPYASDREGVRARLAPGDFLEIYMKVPLELCEARDPKGLYKKARAGQIKNFTGINDPYEAPTSPEITVEPYRADGSQRSPEEMAEEILGYLDSRGYLRDPRLAAVQAGSRDLAKQRSSSGVVAAGQM